MKNIIRSLLYVSVGLIFEGFVLFICCSVNEPTNDGTTALQNLGSSMWVLIFVLVFTVLEPIILSFIKDFKPLSFILIIPIECCLLFFITIGSVGSDSAMEYLSRIFLVVSSALLFVISFIISFITVKVKMLNKKEKTLD